MRDYELVLVLNPEVDETGVAAVVERVHSFITERGGAITHQESWGNKRLAYPIKRAQQGNYMLTQFTSDPRAARELEASLRGAGEVIRYLLVKREAVAPRK